MKVKNPHIDAAIRKAGGTQVALGQLLRPPVSRGVVNDWVRSGRVPPDRCAEVEEKTGIRVELLNPHFSWPKRKFKAISEAA